MYVSTLIVCIFVDLGIVYIFALQIIIVVVLDLFA